MISYIVFWFVSCFATTAATIIGFGVAEIVLPVAFILFPVQQAILLVALLHCFASAWKVLLFWPHIDLKLLFIFGIPSIIGSMIGALLLVQLPIAFIYKLFGFLLITYAFFILFNPTFKVAKSYAWGSVGGVIFGFMAGLFGIQGAIRSAFLMAYDLPKEVYLATAGMIAVMIDVTRISTYLYKGFYLTDNQWLLFLLILPGSFIFALFGRAIVDKIPHLYFRRIIALFLIVVGSYLLFFK